MNDNVTCQVSISLAFYLKHMPERFPNRGDMAFSFAVNW